MKTVSFASSPEAATQPHSKAADASSPAQMAVSLAPTSIH